MKVALAQLNPIVGDIEGNYLKLVEAFELAHKEKADLVVFPELYLVGYAPNDLLERPSFRKKIVDTIKRIVDISTYYPETGVLLGTPLPHTNIGSKGLYNAAILIYQGRILLRQPKSLLSAHDVFYETRYFDAASDVYTTHFKGEILGVTVCQDIWNDAEYFRIFQIDPLDILTMKGATLFINLSASPFHAGKDDIRYKLLRNHSRKHLVPFVYVNMVGGNDGMIFDGKSMCLDRNGEIISVLPAFKECVEIVDMNEYGKAGEFKPANQIKSVYDALILGINDHAQKCGFKKAVLGLSGGLDSTLTCVLAVNALGKDNVIAVFMPSHSTTGKDEADVRKLVENLGIELKVIPTNDIFENYSKAIKDELGELEGSESEKHLENRIRGSILMAFYNKYGYMVLATGNKTELALGCFTLYGDNSGWLGILSDVPKTMVYELARYINRKDEVIPQSIIDKPPTSKYKIRRASGDEDISYSLIDKIIYHYIECGCSKEQLLEKKFNPDVVNWVLKSLDKFWNMREQLPPGLKVTNRAFGAGLRIPIAAKFEV